MGVSITILCGLRWDVEAGAEHVGDSVMRDVDELEGVRRSPEHDDASLQVVAGDEMGKRQIAVWQSRILEIMRARVRVKLLECEHGQCSILLKAEMAVRLVARICSTV
jgi:hypothetical protein